MASELKITFSNDAAREHFTTWLCESGEQDYWGWMEIRESEEDGDITAVKFKYHDENSKFRPELVETECGRLEKDEEEECQPT